MKVKRERWSSNFSEWYDWVLSEAEIYDYGRYPVKGVGIWRPYGFKIREKLLELVRRELNQTGHEEVLFPLLIPEELIKKETEHIKGFENEVLWVTKGGESETDTRMALRPTSEVAISYMESLWLKSYKQLPKKYYQIVSIFRYETKATRPLIRLREVTTFKEAHTIHLTYDDAERQVMEAVEIYRKIFDMLGIPYIISRRPDWDKFPGAEYTIAFETLMPDLKTLQIGTVHHLGQKFTKALDVKIQAEDGSLVYPHQTSYGLSDRVISALISIHGDDHGPILHPLIAPIKVVIIPIPSVNNQKETLNIIEHCKRVKDELGKNDVDATIDEDTELTPGEKFYKWELKGVPLRVEIGPRELNSNTVYIKRRDTLEGKSIQFEELVVEVTRTLTEIGLYLKERGEKFLKEHIFKAENLEEAKKALNEGKGIVEVHWCNDNKCGLKLEEITGGQVKGVPFEKREVNGSCVVCGKTATNILRIAKTY
ncbi:proline--tRNA ligase [Sulfolobales archaeon HS-7]|nr:proline--tRNA ligase [Sulfolobales archaeon HS-7]